MVTRVGGMSLKKGMKGKATATATARMNRRSWKRWLEEKGKKLKRMEAKARKLKEENKRMEEEGRNANSEMEEKESEFALIKQAHMLATEENAAIQSYFDAALVMIAQDVRAPSRPRRRQFSPPPGSDGG